MEALYSYYGVIIDHEQNIYRGQTGMRTRAEGNWKSEVLS